MTVYSEIAFGIPQHLNRPLPNLRRVKLITASAETCLSERSSLTVIEAFVWIIRIITNSLINPLQAGYLIIFLSH